MECSREKTIGSVVLNIDYNVIPLIYWTLNKIEDDLSEHKNITQGATTTLELEAIWTHYLGRHPLRGIFLVTSRIATIPLKKFLAIDLFFSIDLTVIGISSVYFGILLLVCQ